MSRCALAASLHRLTCSVPLNTSKITCQGRVCAPVVAGIEYFMTSFFPQPNDFVFQAHDKGHCCSSRHQLQTSLARLG
jgi:hypothetical protein